MTKGKTASATPKADLFHAIEGRHFGRCRDQVWGKGRVVLVELLEWPKARSTVVIVKEYASKVPDSDKGDRGPWPDLKGVHVYTAIDADDGGTWQGLDIVLSQYEEKRQAGEAAQAI